ncbi:hypothetical protein NL526_29220, partial [Klebsiella pneumoniae]|nr:hypothetical protein [Klebsiella pneumoniae]
LPWSPHSDTDGARALTVRQPERRRAITAAAAKVTFDRGGAFIRETRAEVETYLASGRRRVWGAVQLYVKAPVAFGLVAVSWAA